MTKYVHKNGCYATLSKGCLYELFEKEGSKLGVIGERELLDFGFDKEKDVYEKFADHLSKYVKMNEGYSKKRIKELAQQHFPPQRDKVIDIDDFVKWSEENEVGYIGGCISRGYLRQKGFTIINE